MNKEDCLIQGVDVESLINELIKKKIMPTTLKVRLFFPLYQHCCAKLVLLSRVMEPLEVIVN